MKVLYDHQAFQMQYFGGVSKCFCELISNLPSEVKATISIVQSNNVHLQESGLVPDLQWARIDHKKWNSLFPGKLSDILYLTANYFLPLPTADSINRRTTNKALLQQDFDIFHPTYFKPEFLKYIGKKPFVLTIHDMMPELFPQYYGKNYKDIHWKKILAEKASAIVAVSETTKKDIVRILGIPDEKITVIYHGGPKEISKHISYNQSDPYFLYVGQRNYYKNFLQTLHAFANIATKQEMKKIRLVCTGQPFSNDEKELISSMHLEEHLVFCHPSDDEMQKLYQGAVAFIYPSAYEGFGIPILEAFANHCPVLLNKASCFPEVAADAAVYFDIQNDENSLAEAILTALHWTTQERQALIDKGSNRLHFFSWQKAAIQLTDVYQKVLLQREE